MQLAILNIEDKCTGCGACVNICPRKCLKLKADKEGFYYPEYDESQCINCGLCEKTCKEVTPIAGLPTNREYIYVYHVRDEVVREKSTSGGAFTSFANMVLKNGGVVYATRYNAENRRVEVSSTDVNTLGSFRKSKYVESYVGDALSGIRDNLRKGRQVLFCGTPCQVAGLKAYLKTANVDTEKLITLDFVCHGVPSMKCLDAFLRFEEKRGKRQVVDVDFRYKDFSKKKHGWHNMNYCEYFNDGSKKVLGSRSLHYYYYYYPFLENRILRKSCYSCNQILHSCADVSIGDFWGIRKYKAIKDDNKGLSFLVFNNRTMENVWLKEVGDDFVEKIPFYPNEKQYTETHREHQRPARDAFYQMIEKHGYIKAVQRTYLPRYFSDWAKRIFSSIVKR